MRKVLVVMVAVLLVSLAATAQQADLKVSFVVSAEQADALKEALRNVRVPAPVPGVTPTPPEALSDADVVQWIIQRARQAVNEQIRQDGERQSREMDFAGLPRADRLALAACAKSATCLAAIKK